MSRTYRGVIRNFNISAQGLAKIRAGKTRNLAVSPENGRSLDIEQVRTWINSLLAASGYENVEIPAEVSDAVAFSERMTVIMQLVSNGLDKQAEQQEAFSTEAVDMSIRARGKSRSLGAGRLPASTVRDLALRYVGIQRKG